MKDFEGMMQDILQEYSNALSELKKDQCLTMVRTEIFLCGLSQLGFIGKDISKSWALLSGYQYNNGKYHIVLEQNQCERVAKMRGFMQFSMGSNAFRRLLNDYIQLPRNMRLFHIEIEDKVYLLRENIPSLFSGRKQLLNQAFDVSIPFKINKQDYIAQKNVYLMEDGKIESIRLPEQITNRAHLSKASIIREDRIDELVISKQQLVEMACYMDGILPGRNYKERANKIFWDQVSEDGSVVEIEELVIKDLLNIVGRVGAGKSTLVEILATYMAQKGHKVTIVVDSIYSILQYLDMFEQLGIKAVPIWGYRNRETHIQKGLSHLKEESFLDIEACNYHKWLSEICPLDGLRTASDINKTFSVGKEPCFSLIEDLKEEKMKQCPYYDICPSHKADNELPDAMIYMTTPAAFIKSKVSTAIWKESVRVSEFLYYRSDLVIFDESDRVQIQFDQCFAESLTLFDDTKKSYLNSLAPKIEAWYCNDRLKHAGDKRVQNWYVQFRNTQRCSDLIIAILKENKWLIKKLEGRYYTAYSLTDMLERELEKEGQLDKDLLKELREFIIDNLKESTGPIHAIYRTAISEQNDAAIINEHIKLWWSGSKENELSENLIDCIKYIILSSIFEKSLKSMVNGLEELEVLKVLDIEQIGTFYRAIKDYLSLIPASPMGNLFGFRVTINEKRELKSFIVFKATGMGRWLLTNYHQLYMELDNRKGPHVILLSGTSWAPGSYSYHVNAPVNVLLKGTQEDFDAVGKSKFMLEPIAVDGEYIKVSGTSEQLRINNIQKIVQGLFKRQGGFRAKTSRIEQELGILEENRKKVLLLVGSYEEAEEVKKYLDSFLMREGGIRPDEVTLLIKDQAQESQEGESVLARGQVGEFGKTEAKVLIAPLLALERGHNILNQNNEAAIGAVYFLIRPMPVPNDMNIILHMLSSYMLGQMDKIDRLDLVDYMDWIKVERDKTMTRMQQLLISSQYLGYKQLSNTERTALCMTQFVVLCQVIGRLVRGGCKARVHFCDAKFAPYSLKNQRDTAQSSLLVGIIEALAPFMENNEQMDVNQMIARELYYPFYKNLKECEGLNYEIQTS